MSAIGLYAVLAFSVVRRTREVGIRIAVGASGSSVVAMFAREVDWLVALGVLESPLRWPAKAWRSRGCMGSPRTTSGTIAGAVRLVSAAAATVIPAWRAARLKPVAALRQE